MNKILLLFIVLVSASACSLKDKKESGYGVSVQLPSTLSSSAPAVSRQFLGNQYSSLPSSAKTNYANPTGLNSFQCYGLNVVGPGIQPDPRYNCSSPSGGMGLVGGLVSVAGGKIDVMVPAGPARTVQLLGIQSAIGCPLLNDLLNSGGLSALEDLGEPYIISTAVVDIFDDTALTMTASFNSTKKAFEGCGNHYAKRLTIESVNESRVLQVNNCQQVVFRADDSDFISGVTVLPDVIPVISGAGANIYTDPGCSAAYSGTALSFPAGSNKIMNLYLKSTTVNSTFSMQVTTTDTGWESPVESYTVAENRIEITQTGPNYLNGCYPMSLFERDSSSTLAGQLTNVSLNMYNSSGTTPPSVSIFSDAACTTSFTSGEVSLESASGTERSFLLNFTSQSQKIIYLKYLNIERIGFGVSKDDNTAQGAGSGTTVMPSPLSSVRKNHTVTPLSNGNVIVIGGLNGSLVTVGIVEMYDPVALTWSILSSMSTNRSGHTATLLPSGKILVAGGYTSGVSIQTVEVYDPSTNTWSTKAPMSTQRKYHTATLLDDGKVLVVGGIDSGGTTLASAEIYDPVANTWTATGTFTNARSEHTATLLDDGDVLIVGGAASGSTIAMTERYDSISQTWSNSGSLSSGTYGHTATLLDDGTVLVVGGSTNTTYTSSILITEIYDGTSWSAGSGLITARSKHSATLLPDGRVMVVGGGFSASTDYGSVEIYDPINDVWTSAEQSLFNPRREHAATLMSDGTVLIIGGSYMSTPISSVEQY